MWNTLLFKNTSKPDPTRLILKTIERIFMYFANEHR